MIALFLQENSPLNGQRDKNWLLTICLLVIFMVSFFVQKKNYAYGGDVENVGD